MSRSPHTTAFPATRATADAPLDWACAAAVLAFAAVIRLLFFRGPLGTDEIVYITRAYHLLNGDPVAANYIGALRYGINAFQALSFRLFGSGLVGADGLFFACSLGQILLAYAFAHHLWGRTAAIWAALALATTPIDVTVAGSLNPDPYLALIISSSITVFYVAQQEDRPALYALAGFLAGWVLWIKEAVIVYAGVFPLLALSNRRRRAGWAWFTLAGALCVVAHLALFWMLYGDPLFMFEVLRRSVGGYVTHDIADTSLWTYGALLLVRIYHTGLLGWLALFGCILGLVRGERSTRFVVIWAVGLLAIFSALPISFSPLKFIAKQANYIEIFLLPLVLLAGWFLAQQRRLVAALLGGMMVLAGVMLSGLEQQTERVVTANGRSAAEFAEAHADVPVFGPLTAQRQSAVARLLRGSLDSGGDIRPVDELTRVSLEGASPNAIVAYIIEDPQMRNWPGARTDAPLPLTTRACLIAVGPLAPADLGYGRWVVAALRSVFSLFPPPYAGAAFRATDPLWEIAPAQVYGVTRQCAQQAPSGQPS